MLPRNVVAFISLFDAFPPVQDLVRAIHYMPIPVRKALITLCRVRSPYNPRSRAYTRLVQELKQPFTTYTPIAMEITLIDLLPPCDQFISSPILSGLISMLVRNIPFYHRDEVVALTLSSVEKEVKASLEVYPHPVFNWESVLSNSAYTRHSTVLSDGYPLKPEVHDAIYEALLSTKHVLSSRRLYPDYSRKTLGLRATRSLLDLDRQLGYVTPNTTQGLETMYHHEGIRVTGPTEMRTAFKYNDIKPRTYYARGPDQYYDSRYIQEIFNVIVDSLSTTHRFHRFHTNFLEMTSDETLFIYDYASFTSTLFEIRRFTAALAEFYKDTWVEIIDTNLGKQMINLGEMMNTYNESCNVDPSYDIGVYCDPYSGEDPISISHNCGMLGVPGNISSCTLLHGIHLIVLLMHLMGKVIGDDALAKGVVSSRSEVHYALSALGNIASEKMEFWDDREFDEEYDPNIDAWHYTKRPITRIGSRVQHEAELIIWPSIGNLLRGYQDDLHTVHLPDHEYDYKKRIASSLRSFVLQFQGKVEMDTDEITFIDRWLRWMLRKGGLEYWDEKSRSYQLYARVVFPVSVREGINVDQWVDRMWTSPVTLPRPYEPIPSSPVEIGIPRKSVLCKSMKLLRDFGYANIEQDLTTFLVMDNEELFRMSLSKVLYPSQYTVTIFDTVPLWLLALYVDETDSHHEHEHWDILSSDIEEDSDV